MNYENLIQTAVEENIIVYETKLSEKIRGLYADNVIAISSAIKTTMEKTCILAEELGHHYTTVGDILNQSKIENRKQEERARHWAVKKLAPLRSFINAFETGCRTKEEFAENMEITEEFLTRALDCYSKKYGLMTCVDKQYMIYFNPFGITRLYEER
jgi:Zn-dependent peptidase ImmA (M78 family)